MGQDTTEDKLKNELTRLRGVRAEKERMLKIRQDISKERQAIKEASRVDMHPAVVAAGKKVRSIASSAVKNATASAKPGGGFGDLFKADLGAAPKKEKGKDKKKPNMFGGVFE